MDIDGALRVRYWAARDGNAGLSDLNGIDDFRAELSARYIAQIHARPAGLGGLYGLTVEFLTSFSLHDFIKLVLDGIAWDLVKSGGEALVLKPFVAAYNALKKKNGDGHRGVYIDELSLSFQDSTVIIHNISDDSIVRNIERVLKTLAENYSHLILRDGEKPFLIRIPIVEDLSEDRLCRFRELLDEDETITDFNDERYVELWGVEYDYSSATRVFDVKKQILIDEGFYTQAQYWGAWEKRRKSAGAK